MKNWMLLISLSMLTVCFITKSYADNVIKTVALVGAFIKDADGNSSYAAVSYKFCNDLNNCPDDGSFKDLPVKAQGISHLPTPNNAKYLVVTNYHVRKPAREGYGGYPGFDINVNLNCIVDLTNPAINTIEFRNFNPHTSWNNAVNSVTGIACVYESM